MGTSPPRLLPCKEDTGKKGWEDSGGDGAQRGRGRGGRRWRAPGCGVPPAVACPVSIRQPGMPRAKPVQRQKQRLQVARCPVFPLSFAADENLRQTSDCSRKRRTRCLSQAPTGHVRGNTAFGLSRGVFVCPEKCTRACPGFSAMASRLYEGSWNPAPGQTSLVAQTVKHLSTMREICIRSLGREDSLEKEMATYSSTLAWKIPWTEELGAGYCPRGRKESGTTT